MNLKKFDAYLKEEEKGNKGKLDEGDLKQEMMWNKKVKNVVEKAQDAFWNVVMTEYKEAKTNNIDSYTLVDFNGMCERVIRGWCNMNMPRPKNIYPEENKSIGGM